VTPPRTIIGGVLDTEWFRSPLKRRLTFAVAAAILGVLSLYPQHYVAETQLMPQSSGGGLSTVLAQQSSGALLDLGALTGNTQSVEADLTIARSQAVIDGVVNQLHLVGMPGFRSRRQAEAKLKHKLKILAIRGSILQIKAEDRDPAFAKALVAAAGEAVRNRLAEISLQQAAQKRAVATDRLADATTRLANAQTALNQFRVENKLPAPETQLGAGVGILAGLQSRLQAKQVELGALEEVNTGENIQVKLAQAEIASLQRQIAQAQSQSGLGLAGMVSASTKYNDLYRDYTTAELLYQVQQQISGYFR